MRVVSFNVKRGLTAGGRVDNRLLASACAGLGAEVLALQEVDRRALRGGLADQVRVVARATGLTAVFGEAARRGPFRRYGIVLLGRGALSDVEVVGLPQPDGGEHRVAVLARLALSGGPNLSVGATHLSFRGEGPVQLDALVELMGRRPPPRILLGDLNLGPEVVEPRLAAAGYQVAPTGPTFPARSPRSRIDYVAVAGLEVVTAETPELPVSDHRPVVAEVVVAEAGRSGTG